MANLILWLFAFICVQNVYAEDIRVITLPHALVMVLSEQFKCGNCELTKLNIVISKLNGVNDELEENFDQLGPIIIAYFNKSLDINDSISYALEFNSESNNITKGHFNVKEMLNTERFKKNILTRTRRHFVPHVPHKKIHFHSTHPDISCHHHQSHKNDNHHFHSIPPNWYLLHHHSHYPHDDSSHESSASSEEGGQRNDCINQNKDTTLSPNILQTTNMEAEPETTPEINIDIRFRDMK